MKKLFLLFFVSLLFLGCKSDYEESKWIIVNNFDKDIHSFILFVVCPLPSEGTN